MLESRQRSTPSPKFGLEKRLNRFTSMVLFDRTKKQVGKSTMHQNIDSAPSAMEKHFQKFRKNVIGENKKFQTILGQKQRIVYADWTASGRLVSRLRCCCFGTVYR